MHEVNMMNVIPTHLISAPSLHGLSYHESISPKTMLRILKMLLLFPSQYFIIHQACNPVQYYALEVFEYCLPSEKWSQWLERANCYKKGFELLCCFYRLFKKKVFIASQTQVKEKPFWGLVTFRTSDFFIPGLIPLLKYVVITFIKEVYHIHRHDEKPDPNTLLYYLCLI